MAKDRARDDRRSVGSHEKMLGALGRAAGWEHMSSGPEGRVIGKIGSGRVNVTGQAHVVAGEDLEDLDRDR